jgi:hypothetical protein
VGRVLPFYSIPAQQEFDLSHLLHKTTVIVLIIFNMMCVQMNLNPSPTSPLSTLATMMPIMQPVTSSAVVQEQKEENCMSGDCESVMTALPEDILCGVSDLLVTYNTGSIPSPIDATLTSLSLIVTIQKNKICMTHEGSKNFRRVIESYTLKYQQATSRQAKMNVTKEIFDQFQTRRFLKYNDETGMWEVLHPLAVRDKIGHALRFSNRKGSTSIRKQVRRSNPDADVISSSQNTGFVLRPSSSTTDSALQRTHMEECHWRPSASTLSQFANTSGLQRQMGFFELLNQSNINIAKQLQQHYQQQKQQELVQTVSPPSSDWCSSNWNAQQTEPSKLFDEEQNEMDLSWMLQMPLLELE